MKNKFTFDKKTGTFVSHPEQQNHNPVSQTNTSEVNNTFKKVEQESLVDKNRSQVFNRDIIKMKRVKIQTPVQLVDDKGLPESYLDAANTGIMMFREREDYDICQITDERTGKPLAYIGGYALQFNFNMTELRTMEKIEACLQGLTKLFRQKIMTQKLGSEDK